MTLAGLEGTCSAKMVDENAVVVVDGQAAAAAWSLVVVRVDTARQADTQRLDAGLLLAADTAAIHCSPGPYRAHAGAHRSHGPCSGVHA